MTMDWQKEYPDDRGRPRDMTRAEVAAALADRAAAGRDAFWDDETVFAREWLDRQNDHDADRAAKGAAVAAQLAATSDGIAYSSPRPPQVRFDKACAGCGLLTACGHYGTAVPASVCPHGTLDPL